MILLLLNIMFIHLSVSIIYEAKKIGGKVKDFKNKLVKIKLNLK